MANDITLKIGADASGVKSGIEGATKSFDQLLQKSLGPFSKALQDVEEQSRSFETRLKLVATSAATATAGVVAGVKSIGLLSDSVSLASNGTSGLAKTFANVATTSGKLSAVLSTNSKSLVGLTIRSSTLAAGFLVLSEVLNKSNNDLLKTLSTVSLFAALITGAFSIALAKGISLIGGFVSSLGTKMVEAAQASSAAFVEFEKKVFIFERTITNFDKALDGSIGRVEEYESAIKALSTATATSEKDLRGAAAELVQTLGPIGFTQEQILKLLEITTDYSASLGGDVIQTTIEFVSALNGSAQSVQKYGVKLNEAAVEQKLFDKGLNVNFQGLTANEQAQQRFNVLLDQYKPTAGLAAELTGTLAGQQKVLENNLNRVNQSFGAGASIIENTNIQAAAANLVLNSVNETVVKASGFMFALGARVLQIGGFFLQWSLTITLAIKALKVINILLGASATQSALGKSLPLINKSFLDIVKSTGAASVSFTSLGAIIKTIVSVTVSQLKLLTAAIFGVEVSALSLSTILKGALVRSIQGVALAVRGLSSAFLALIANPIVITIAAIGAVAITLFKSFKALEERTGAVSEVFGVLGDSIAEIFGVAGGFLSIFTSIGSVLSGAVSRAFGFVTVAISGVTFAFIELLKLNPLNVFSQDKIDRLQATQDKLRSFASTVASAGYDINKAGEQIASGLDKALGPLGPSGQDRSSEIAAEVERLTGAVRAIQKEYEDFGLSQVEIIRKTEARKQQIIQESANAGIVTASEAATLSEEIALDSARKIAEIRRREAENANRDILQAYSSLENQLADFGLSEIEAVQATQDARLKIINDAVKIGQKSEKEALKLRTKVISDGLKKIQKIEEDAAKKRAKPLNDLFDEYKDFGKDEITLIKETEKRKLEIIDQAIKDRGDAEGKAAKLRLQVIEDTEKKIKDLQNKNKNPSGSNDDPVFVEQAQSVSSKIIEGFSTGFSYFKSFIDGTFIDQIISALEEFVTTIPERFEGFLSRLDVVLEKLGSAFGSFLQKLPELIPKIFAKLNEAARKVIADLLKNLPAIFDALLTAATEALDVLLEAIPRIIELIPGLVTRFLQELPRVIDRILKAVPEIIKEIAQAIPLIVRGIADALPDVVIAIAENIAPIAAALVEAIIPLIPQVIIALVDSLIVKGGIFRIAFALMKAIYGFLPQLAFNLIKNLTPAFRKAFDAIKNFKFPKIDVTEIRNVLSGKNLIEGIQKVFSGNFVERLRDALTARPLFAGLQLAAQRFQSIFTDNPVVRFFRSLFDQPPFVKELKRVFDQITKELRAISGSGGGDGIIVETGKRIGFAEGGLVPSGFPNDTFPARLTSGEQVIDRTDNQRLSKFLDLQEKNSGSTSQAQTIVIQLKVGESQLADVMYQLSRKGFRTA